MDRPQVLPIVMAHCLYRLTGPAGEDLGTVEGFWVEGQGPYTLHLPDGRELVCQCYGFRSSGVCRPGDSFKTVIGLRGKVTREGTGTHAHKERVKKAGGSRNTNGAPDATETRKTAGPGASVGSHPPDPQADLDL